MSLLIPLTQGKSSIIDDEMFDLVSQFKWSFHENQYRDGIAYAGRSIRVNGKQVTQYIHTLITDYDMVNHINGDGLDNRLENLRPSNRSLNRSTALKTRTSKSHYKGAYYRRSSRKWNAQIRINGVTVSLGYFQKESDAARAYDDAARIHFGGFATLNFPLDGERGCLRGRLH